MMFNDDSVSKAGPFNEFVIGCNYFASHAGLFMWSRWDEAVVAEDFRTLKAHGMDYVRVFPLWSDFQVLTPHMRGTRIETMRNKESPFPNTPAGRACVRQEMLDRLKRLLDLASEHGLKVMIDLITGWMSGRNFRPDILLDKPLHSDPLSLQSQVRLVRCLVDACKGHECVVAWGLGNECNMGSVFPNRETAWNWTALIAATIRAADQSRPVISGMHGLAVCEDDASWFIRDQAENTDMLTTHPYPYYTPHSHRDPITANRVVQFPAAQSTLYSDIGGKPCLTQELGVLGPMIGNGEKSAAYLSSVLWSLWTCGDAGALWWMGFDTPHIPETPYEWQATEIELGFLTERREPKPMLGAMEEFKNALRSLPWECRRIPKHRADAVCLLSHSQENWTVAYSAFVMAKQAGFDIRFVHPDAPLPDAAFYMVPSIRLVYSVSRSKWKEVVKKVENGAGLYLSFSSAFIADFKTIAGAEIMERRLRSGPIRTTCANQSLTIPHYGGDGREAACQYDLDLCGATVLCTEADNRPLLLKNRLGKGYVYTLLTAIEAVASLKQGALGVDLESDYAVFYSTIFRDLILSRNIIKASTENRLSLSEHLLQSGKTLGVGINHGSEKLEGILEIHPRVKNVSVIRGVVNRTEKGLAYNLKPHDAFVVVMETGSTLHNG